MTQQSAQTQDSQTTAESDVRELYRAILDGWNRRSSSDMAALFADNGNVVGFDGSQLNGRAEIEASMRQIFAHHETSAYVGIVREVRFLAPDVALLRAVVGMVPPGKSDLNPDTNAIQSLVAVKRNGKWQIALYQNTPAQFHGRPEAVQQLTDELRQLLR